MNRLRDETGDDPVEGRGIDLLRGTPSTPRMPELKRRVWARLQQSNARRGPALRLSALRVAALVTAGVCLAGSAVGAVIAARRWIAPASRDGASPAASLPPSRGAVARHLAAKAPPMLALAPDEAPAPAASLSTTASSAEGSPPPAARKIASARRVPLAAPARRGPAEVSDVSPTAAAIRERTEVLDAMIALRRDHDPLGASVMLDRYLAAHPSGALREEALVLAIEAASARGERSAARKLARSYQDAYPNGRFRRFAQSQSQPAPSDP